MPRLLEPAPQFADQARASSTFRCGSAHSQSRCTADNASRREIAAPYRKSRQSHAAPRTAPRSDPENKSARQPCPESAHARRGSHLCKQLKRSFGRAESGNPSAMSAPTTPTSVTPWMSCPFAIICVPTSMSSAPSFNAFRACSKSSRPRTVSRSSRPIRACGNMPCSNSSSFSDPVPTK